MKMKKNRTKQQAAVTGMILIAVILVGSTFAFQMMNQATPTSNLVESSAGGRIHNVFEGRPEGNATAGVRNQNVFAENFGEFPIGVRVQIREFMATDGEPIQNREREMAMDENDFTTWSIFLTDQNLNRRGGTTAGDIGRQGVVWSLGQQDEKIFMPTFNHVNRRLNHSELGTTVAPTSPFYNQFTYAFSEASGRALAEVLVPAGEGEGVVPQRFQTGYPEHTGLRDFWYEGQALPGTRFFINNAGVLDQESTIHYAQATLEPDTTYSTSGVMTLTQWIAANRPPGNFWILDDTNDDGWFLWNGMIPAESATSLLLEEINLPVHTSLDYRMRVHADFFTAHNMPEDLSTGHLDVLRPALNPMAELPQPLESGNNCAQTGNPANVWVDTTGFEWCVVRNEGNYAMLVSRFVVDMTGFAPEGANNRPDSTTNFTFWPTNTTIAGGPEIRNRINAWFNTDHRISETLRENAVDANTPNLNNTITIAGANERVADSTAISTPLPNSTGDNPVFFLSPAEVTQVLRQTTDAERVTRREDTRIQSTGYHLRSAGNSATTASHLSSSGVFSSSGTFNDSIRLSRPAIWVRR